MMRWLVNRMLDAAERRYNYDVSYMRAMVAASLSAAVRFNKVAALARHREAAPRDACEAARLAGTLAEDCGPCTQIVVDMARENGMADEQIAAVLTADLSAMNADTRLGYDFARAVIGRLPEADELREQVRSRWGDKGVLDLTLGAQMSRTYPMIKAGLGYARSCGTITIGTTTVARRAQRRSMQADPFGSHRKRLLGLAYRMLGSRAEAEDVLQDAWLRLNTTREVDNRDALLTTIVTRLCLDRLKSARVRREVYVGPWLPEPVIDSEALAVDTSTELANDLSFALLLALERLTPTERAAFLLHDVFDLPFVDIAAMLDRSAVSCRQLASRARKAVRAERPVVRASEEAHQRLLSAFCMAITTGEVAALTTLLREDAILLSDGGGKVITARKPIFGADRIARFFVGVTRKFRPAIPNLRSEIRPINGALGLVIWSGDRVEQVLTLAIDGERIAAVYVVRNPEKLAWLGREPNGPRRVTDRPLVGDADGGDRPATPTIVDPRRHKTTEE